MEIGHIIKGHINEALNLNKDISKSRMQICLSCPLYSPILGGICNSKLWLDPLTGEVSTNKKDGYVNGCECRLSAKTRLTDAKCPANKW